MIINVAFSSDNNYSQHLCVSLYTLAEHSNLTDTYNIYILDGGISKKNKEMIENSLQVYKNLKIAYIEAPRNVFQNVITHLHLNQSSYYRLILPELLLHVDKLLYFDCDMVFLDDVSKLYNVDIDNNIVGACRIFHPNYAEVLKRCYKTKHLSIIYNAGTLIMNLKLMRAERVTEKLLRFMNENSGKLLAGDQDVINVVLNKRIQELDPRWNASSYLFVARNQDDVGLNQREFSVLLSNPAVIHFDGGKPWKSGYRHPYSKAYFKTLKKTEFRDYKVSFSFNEYLANSIFFFGAALSNILPESIYRAIKRQYLKNNFLENKLKQSNEKIN